MTLRDLGLAGHGGARESVSIFVGPNGSGKSSMLRDLVVRLRDERDIVVVSNTPHDRFQGLRGVRRLSAGRAADAPSAVVKRAVVTALGGEDSRFYQISSILEYCGYRPRFGFRIERSGYYGFSLRQLRDSTTRQTGPGVQTGPIGPLDDEGELGRALAFLEQHDPGTTIWIDASASALEFSLSREFASVLQLEARLRSLEVIAGITVYLSRGGTDEAIEIKRASSGQLALISTMLFLIVNAGHSPVVVIDEPENSLHPSWQRDYVDKILAAVAYRNATVLIATHAPLVVTGALADSPKLVSVFQVRGGEPIRLDVGPETPSKGIEEILWRAFEVVTPANHYVSERIVSSISLYEDGEIGKADVLRLVDELDLRSFDDRQKRFFDAVRELLDKVGPPGTTDTRT